MTRSFPSALLALAVSIICTLAAGCSSSPYQPLPRIEETVYKRSLPENPQNGTLLAWRGSKRNLHTFWGKQDVQARVKAFLPHAWERPGDGIWRAQVRNGNQKPLPLLGVLRKSGDDSRIVPQVDTGKLSNGLYSLIVPGIETKKQEIASVKPRLLICEIREGRFQPFRVEVPLYPLQKSPLTEAPKADTSRESSPEGTPYPFSLPASQSN